VHLVLCTGGGRPFLVDERPRVAGTAHGDGSGAWAESGSPCLSALSDEARASLAAAWTADALLEHASIASFSRFALGLLAVGAPAALVDLAHRAALDEVRHARACFGLASAYAGERIAPGPFPFDGRVDVEQTLAALAASTAWEGCVGETLAAVLASERLSRATDPAVRAALAEIAADEARHAELAWRTVAWALRTGGHDVREAVAKALAEALEDALDRRDAHGERAGLEAHGRLDGRVTARTTERAAGEIILPAMRALLADVRGHAASFGHLVG
jgi:hypothetical protein